MKHYIFPAMVCLVLIFSACSQSDDFRLSSSIFIHDDAHPGLPIYSEWGYNTFGAYFDRTPFVSDNYLMPVKVTVKPDTCQIAFTGKLQSKNEEATLTFHLLNYQPNNFFDLLSLDKKTFSLVDEEIIVTFLQDKKIDTLNVMEGELSVKRAQKLLVDKEEKKVVLSGTFSMKAAIGNEPVSINNGRFDVSVDNINFFKGKN
ncbi:MAG: hypothetical protein Q4G48_02285 [Bacteroidia bacterium]|nr:hypothetical protein [Bacteroidia bacterium]